MCISSLVFFFNCNEFICVYSGSFFLTSSFSLSLMLSEKFDGLLSRSMFAGIHKRNALCLKSIYYSTFNKK